MKKFVILVSMLLALSLMISGCTNHIDAESTFNHEEVANDLSELSIQVKLPTTLPFDAYNLISNAYPDDASPSYSLNIFAKPEDKEAISITAVEGKLRTPAFSEEVELSEGKTGYYLEQGDVSTMLWEEDGISYNVQHICEEKSKLYSKKGFIQFVNRFE